MSAPVENPIVINVTTSFGYMLIGTVFASMLSGISCMQVFMYYISYPDDPLVLKVLIGALWCLDIAGVGLLLMGLWPPLIANWGSVAVLGSGLPGILHHLWVSSVISTSVQLLFIWRIYKLEGYRMKMIPIFLSVLCLYQLASSIAFTVFGLQNDTLAALSAPTMKGLQFSTRGCTVASDILICVCLLRILAKNGMPVWQSSRQLLSRLIIVTINSGLWTAIFATISLILALVQPNGFSYCIVELPIGSLYLTSMLSNLNAREYIRGRKTEWNEFMSVQIPNRETLKDNDTIVLAGFNQTQPRSLGSESVNATQEELPKAESSGYLPEV
ncbi:hypothetical protein FB451DRAFT_1549193 [Mycena latifolia]|nr:hypothetical protein FB451DRAFT_1549193 [Mycena latifolia]